MNDIMDSETPEEALDQLLENLGPHSHCCECERGIHHHVCIQYCKANSTENCTYQWKGEELIVHYLSEDHEKALSLRMTFEQWTEWIKTNQVIKFGDLGLASP